MEKRLKKERNRLYLRIALIMLALWIIVSSVFCAVYLNVRKDKIESDERLNISLFTQFISLQYNNLEYLDLDKIFLEKFDLLYNEKNEDKNFNSQIIILNKYDNEPIINTAKTVGVRFHVKGAEGNNPEIFGLIKYDSIFGALNETRLKEIEKYLMTNRDDGNYYELICTKCQFKGIYIFPVELKLVLVDGSDKRFLINDNVKTYDLSEKNAKGPYTFECGAVGRNIIPKNFLLKKAYNNNFIASLSEEQKKQSALTIPTGFFENIVYVSNYQDIKANERYGSEDNSWMFQYAKKVNLLEYCKDELTVYAALIFSFFLTIAVILCIMIWKTVKTQIIEEQKRHDLTNALAHDIKTPLFVISGYAYTLQENINNDERDKYVEKILEQTEGIDSLVHRMLDLSKLDSYNVKLNKTEFDLFELVKSTADERVKLSDGKEIKLINSGDNLITADKELVKQAVQNLIDNAVKYSSKNSVIEINVDKKALTVSNPCDNMTKDDLKNITEPYIRKDKSRHQKGNGLGLSIIKSIVNLHGAKLRISLKDNIFSVKIVFS